MTSLKSWISDSIEVESSERGGSTYLRSSAIEERSLGQPVDSSCTPGRCASSGGSSRSAACTTRWALGTIRVRAASWPRESRPPGSSTSPARIGSSTTTSTSCWTPARRGRRRGSRGCERARSTAPRTAAAARRGAATSRSAGSSARSARRRSRATATRAETGAGMSAASELKRSRPPGRTAEQRAAIEARTSDVFTEAGAGTGKTRVLVERYCDAVTEDGTRPDEILAFTFTERAAGELRERIRRQLIATSRAAFEAGELQRAREIARAAREGERAWITTMHGFCRRLLAAHPVAAGMDPRFRVLDEFEAARLGEGAFAAALEEVVDARDEAAARFAAGFHPVRLREAVQAAHERLRSQGIDPPGLPDPGAPVRSVKERDETSRAAPGRGGHRRPGPGGAGLPSRRLPPPLRAPQGGALGGGLRGPRAARARAAGITRGRAIRVARALPAPDGGRVPGHERRPAGADRRAAWPQHAAVRRRRRVPVHLPLPSRRRGGIPPAPAGGERGSPDRVEASARKLPLPAGGARGGQLRRLRPGR